ncbi:MAG: alpha-glucosidase [Erysipelotrichaceae bacterium]|nr:alpha-glucosidase [Erysipelotrichaceae bacterium]
MRTEWYKNAVVYQIYPFSYRDSNNDGWGDIEGIIEKLDYIKELGVTAIWFSPLYRSPDYDYGYDTSDYKDIDPKFGTLEDFDRLLKECHDRDLKVIMDLAVNHTSTEHPWFKEAISSKDSPYRDYYIIREGRRKGKKLLPPTNWESTFTGSAWERIGDTDEFYLHLFCVEQADLNWENPKVREEVVSILNFWLERGVDGFRFDVFNMFSKVYPFGDDFSKDSFQKGAPFYVDGPRMHEFLKELNEKALSRYDTYTVGESFHPSEENAHAYVKESNHELDSIFNFGHLDADNIKGKKFFKKPFDLLQFKDGLFAPQRSYYGEGWNTLVLENHDNARSVSRFGIDTKHYRYEAATMLATLTFMGYGIPFIYMGQEIGMTNCDFKNIDEMKDPVSHFVYDLMCGYGIPKPLAFRFIKYGARDHARTPMQWNDSVNAGFNDGQKPWQCMNPEYKEINVEKDLASERSVYRYYQKLLAIKKNNETAIYGKTEEYDHINKKIAAYSREYNGKRLFVVSNFSNKQTDFIVPQWVKNAKVLLSNYDELIRKGQTLTLHPYQAVIFEERENDILKS